MGSLLRCWLFLLTAETAQGSSLASALSAWHTKLLSAEKLEVQAVKEAELVLQAKLLHNSTLARKHYAGSVSGSHLSCDDFIWPHQPSKFNQKPRAQARRSTRK